MCPALQGWHRRSRARPRRFGHRCRGRSIPAGSGSCGTVRFLRFAVQKTCCEAVVQSGRPTFLISVKSGLKLGPTPPCLPRLGAGPNFVFTQRNPAEFGSQLGGVPIVSVATLRVLCMDGFWFLKSVVKAVLETCRNLGGLCCYLGKVPGVLLGWSLLGPPDNTVSSGVSKIQKPFFFFFFHCLFLIGSCCLYFFFNDF